MSTYHRGELEVQARAGTTALAARVAGMVDPAVAPRARAFLAQQPMVVVATVDPSGQPWASALFGPPGWARADETGEAVALDLGSVARTPGDPLWSQLRVGADVGLVAIDLGTARRLRVNGRIEAADDRGVRVRVREAYPNCPKYIVRRRLVGMGPAAAGVAVRGEELDAERIALVRRADTFFVASRHAARGLDASHRGGPAGFAQVDGRTLRIPDYEGNGMFQTLGNLAVDDRAGVVFLDFPTGRVLQLVGRTRIRYDGGRAWELDVERWIEAPLGATLRWEGP
jgi:predicted pyridoxine 5'-phosphate oxidase superfamily flavin-nucleotide-binding protein